MGLREELKPSFIAIEDKSQPDEDYESEFRHAYQDYTYTDEEEGYEEEEKSQSYWHGFNAAKYMKRGKGKCKYAFGSKEYKDFWRGVSDFRSR
jgi:hypothetical protein